MTSRRRGRTAGQREIFVDGNERVAGAVAVAVGGLAIYEAVVLPGTANGVLSALAGLLQALALLVVALRRVRREVGAGRHRAALHGYRPPTAYIALAKLGPPGAGAAGGRGLNRGGGSDREVARTSG
jgi:hypothetical protein